MMFTDQQVSEFYRGFVTALKWSTGGQPDLSECPDGYEVLETDMGWGLQYDNGEPIRDGYRSEREAVEAAWKHAGEEAPTLESLEDFDLSPDTETDLMAVCRTFLILNGVAIHWYRERREDPTDPSDGLDPSQGTVFDYAGHDFWLTSAGHGVGFWDRNLGDLGDQLTAACEPFRDKLDPYIGDDGLIYV